MTRKKHKRLKCSSKAIRGLTNKLLIFLYQMLTEKIFHSHLSKENIYSLIFGQAGAVRAEWKTRMWSKLIVNSRIKILPFSACRSIKKKSPGNKLFSRTNLRGRRLAI